MPLLDNAADLVDYSVSNRNRKRICASLELGIGILFVILGIGTAMCEVEVIEHELIE